MVKASLKARGHFLGAGVKQFINNKGAGAGAAATLEHLGKCNYENCLTLCKLPW